MKNRVILIIAVSLILTSVCHASFEPSLMQLYTEGDGLLKSYRGDPVVLSKAKNTFLKIVEKFPDSPLGYLGLSRLSVIQAYRYENHYFIPQIKEDALPLALKAMALGPLIPAVHDHYSLLEHIFKDHAEQQETLRQYMALFPEDPKTYFLLGEFLCDRKEFELALHAFQKAGHLKAPMILQGRISKRIAGIYLRFLNDPARAVQEYQSVLDRGDKTASLYESLGLAQFEMKDYAAAADSFRHALALSDSPFVRSYFLQAQGYLSESEGDIAKAIKFLQDALTLSYDRSNLLFVLGKLLFQAQDYAQAQKYFLDLIQIAPYHAQAYYFAGRSAQSLGLKEQAITYFQEYLKLFPDGEESEWIRTNIPDLSQK